LRGELSSLPASDRRNRAGSAQLRAFHGSWITPKMAGKPKSVTYSQLYEIVPARPPLLRRQ
jgi:hypothetical protein